jgi:tetratricopeptide (TPR) repeat protein
MSSKTTNTPEAGQDIDLGAVYSKTELFIEEHKRSIGIGVGALVAAVAIFLGYRELIAKPRAAAADESMWKAEYWYEVDSLDLALNGNDLYPGFLEVADQYGSTPAGKLAHFYVAAILMKQQEYDRAAEHYAKAKVGDDVMRALAIGGIGDAYVELGREADAVKQFEKAANHVKNEFTTPLFLMKAGVIHRQQGNWKAAAKAFNRIVTEFPTSNEFSLARKYAGHAEAMGG